MHTGGPAQRLGHRDPLLQKSEHGGQTQATTLKTLREAWRESGLYVTRLIHSGLLAGNCLHLLHARGLKNSKEAVAMPGTTSPTSGLTSVALPRRPGQGRAGVSEAQGWEFNLRRSREPRACGRLCALSRSQPPGGCLRRNPGPRARSVVSLST